MRLGVLPLIIMCFGIQPIAYVVWLLAGPNYALLLLFAGLLGVGYGGFVALSPVALAGMFGLEGLGGVLGIQYTSAGIGARVVQFAVAAREVLIIATPEPTSITDASAIIKVIWQQAGPHNFKLVVNQARSCDAADSWIRVFRFLDIAEFCRFQYA